MLEHVKTCQGPQKHLRPLTVEPKPPILILKRHSLRLIEFCRVFCEREID